MTEHKPVAEAINPNQETNDAMQAARQGFSVKVGSIAQLLADLHKDESDEP